MAPLLAGIGLLLGVPALMALLTVPIAWAWGETTAMAVFAGSAALTAALGGGLYALNRPVGELQGFDAMRIAALAWLAVASLAALPLWWLAWLSPSESAMTPYREPINALFEGLSGFTATGLSMATEVAALPRSVQWWRSFMEWIGGVGVIVLMLSVLPPHRGTANLYLSEARDQKILPTVTSTVRAIWMIYVLYTGIGITLLWLAGEPAWRALNHGMTAMATGGFSVTDNSLVDLAPLTKLAYLPIMVAGSLSFLLHYRLLWRENLRDGFVGSAELWLFLALLVTGAGLLVLENQASSVPWVDSVFQWVAGLSTTGFQTTDLSVWSTPALLMLLPALLVGGMAGSTTGGFKQLRLLFLLKGIGWQLKAILRTPHELVRYTHDGQSLSATVAQQRVQTAALLALSWLLSLGLAVLMLLHWLPADTPLEWVLFEVASAQGNVGLSTGITGPELPTAAKLVLMTVMWIGRLEIMAVMVLLVFALGGYFQPGYRQFRPLGRRFGHRPGHRHRKHND